MIVRLRHRFAHCIVNNLFLTREYICLPEFSIVGSNAILEPTGCTMFNVYQIYGWDSFSNSYSLLLFDAGISSTIGIWQDKTLTIYQDIEPGYMRISYLVVDKTSHCQNPHCTLKHKLYRYFVDISNNGKTWRRYTQGESGYN